MAAACAASGYAATSVTDVVTLAAVSRKTFYEFFPNKEQCLLAAHEEYFGRLLTAIERSCEPGAPCAERVRAALRAALQFLAADLAVTQLLTIAIVSVGPRGTARYDAMIEALASRLHGGSEKSPPSDAEWGAVALISVLVCKAAIREDPDAILALEDDLDQLFAITTEPA
jgi:AcrR family transcriptional regulator